MTFNRKLDLSGAPKAKQAPKARQKPSGGILTDRQRIAHERAILAVSRWTTKLKRAATEVDKHQKTCRYYERLIAKQAPSE